MKNRFLFTTLLISFFASGIVTLYGQWVNPFNPNYCPECPYNNCNYCDTHGSGGGNGGNPYDENENDNEGGGSSGASCFFQFQLAEYSVADVILYSNGNATVNIQMLPCSTCLPATVFSQSASAVKTINRTPPNPSQYRITLNYAITLDYGGGNYVTYPLVRQFIVDC